MSQRSVEGDPDDLDSPLLEDDEHSEQAGGGVTLHGESVDLRHMLFGRTTISSGNNNNTPNNNNSEQPQLLLSPDAADSPTSTLSLDNKSSNTTPQPSTLDYVKQTLLFVPKKSRSFYYKTRYAVDNYFASSSRNSTSTATGGLTPVDTSGSSASDLQNDESSYNNNNKQRNQITQKSSLYNSTSTPFLLKLLIPMLLVTNHVLFYHAQTAPMWNLSYATNVTISATANTLKSKAAADALNVPHHYEYTSHENNIVETFTYMDAIRKLWKGEGLGDAQTISKVAAVLLIVASGIWPHLKLLLVHVCWFFPFVHGLWLPRNNNGEDGNEEERRCCMNTKQCCTTNNGSWSNNNSTKSRCSLCCSNGHAHETHTIRSPFLRTLSTLGKWSLADVLVVCILIAVLHLDWYVHPDEIRSGIENELPTLLSYAQSKYPDEVKDCTQLLGYTCGRHALVIHFPACLTCQGLISNAYHHPEWTASEGVS